MMSTIAVASGKGGTGKTTVAVGLALALSKKLGQLQFADCDVEEPNADLLLKPVIEGEEAVEISIPEVDEAKCTACGRCKVVCEYNAVAVVKDKALIFENLCHGCGGCSLACPENAISEKQRRIGTVAAGRKEGILFYKGTLNVGEPMATPVVRAVKSRAGDGLPTILDAPPGTACPVIATVKDCDYCLLVTEPTPFGLYDLDLMLRVVKELGIPAGIVINKDDDWSSEIEAFASREDVPVLLKIPFSREIAAFYSKGIPLNETDETWDEEFHRLYAKVENEICQNQLK
jgi:MinD superfamily P-loop ATPase